MEHKPVDAEEFSQQKNLEEFTQRLWQQVKTETKYDEDIEETGYFPPPLREQLYYDTFCNTADQDASFDKDSLYEGSSSSGAKRLHDDDAGSTPSKRPRGRPYTHASVKITCLEPDVSTITSEIAKLQEEGLGIPKSEIVGGLRTTSKLPLDWGADDMRQYIFQLFPRLKKFRYMKCNKAKGLSPLPDNLKPKDMRHYLRRSALYIVPIGPLKPKEDCLPESTQESCPGSPIPTSSTSSITMGTPCSSSNLNSNNTTGGGNNTVNSNFSYWLPVKISGEKVISDDREFRITFDVSHFSPEEITVKTKDNRIVVQAKHTERQDQYGFVERQITRQYHLPADVNPNELTSSLSASGILTLKAPKVIQHTQEERIIPIQHEMDTE